MDMSKIIDLDRRFYKATGKEAEEAAQSSYLLHFLDDRKYGFGYGWSELFDFRVVVVLGEPGSGKTTEFQAQSENLRAKDVQAFYVKLDQLVGNRFSEVLPEIEHQRFHEWKKGNAPAHFFLDAVDESKLRRPADFFTVLDKILASVEARNLPRTHLIFSSRISEWRPEMDLSEVRKRFVLQLQNAEKGGKDDKDAKDDVLVVHLAPMDHSRVRIYAESRGIQNLDGFLQALDDHHAWEFARRPWDVNALIEFWQMHGRLGGLTELIENNITESLREKRDTDTLSGEAARQGAESLAGAAVFCRNLNFRVPDPAHIPETRALNPLECLPADWPVEQSRSLLSRVIFDGAAYGCIRFHHRRELEYLAASWLSKTMESRCPLIRLEDLLFSTYRGQKVLRPSMAPVAAWIANGERRHNSHVRDLLVQVAPEIHLKFGDPAQLPLGYKRKILDALAARYRDRKKAWIDSEAQALARLADPAFATDVAKIIVDKGLSPDFRSEMLSMARYGNLAGCLEAAYAIVEDAAEDPGLKVSAAATLRDTGDLPMLQRLVAHVRSLSTIPSNLAVIFCQALYPRVMDADGLVDLLKKSEPAKKHSYEFPGSLSDHLRTSVAVGQVKQLFKALMNLAVTPPLHNSGYQVPISQRFMWLCELFPELLLQLLEEKNLSEEEAELAAQCTHLLEDHSGHSHRNDEKALEKVREAIKVNIRVRRAYFWKSVEQIRLRDKGEPTWIGQIIGWNSNPLVSQDQADISWLAADALNRPAPEDRKISLRSALDIWNPRQGQWWNWYRLLKAHFQASGLRLLFWKQTGLRLVAPLIGFWWRTKHKYRGYWWTEKRRSLESVWLWIRNRCVLHYGLRHLNSGKHVSGLWFVIHDVGGSSTRNTRNDWDKLGNKWGPLIKRAAQHGCEMSWLKYVPLLPHEKPKPNETDGRVILGLCGLHLLWSKGEINFTQLPEPDAQRAARYAFSELNGFTEWFPDLVIAQPAAVKEVLRTCIEGEWLFPPERQHVSEVLSRISWGEDIAWPLILPGLLGKIGEKDPLHPQVLEASLSILLKTPDSGQLGAIKALIPNRIAGYQADSQFFTIWMSTWLELDAEKALDYLEHQLAAMNSTLADDLLLRLCSSLKGERGTRRSVVDPDYRRPQAMRTLIPLVARHIRVGEDIDRLGGEAYTPGMRDHAQEFRNDLIFNLVNINHSDILGILESLIGIPEMAPLKERIEHLIGEHIAQRGDMPPWAPNEVQEFANTYEIEPRNEEGLFQIACSRISDIKTEVERSENSIRDELHNDWDEAALRRWSQRKLAEQSRGRYNIPQESVIDLEQRPDLKFMHNQIPSSIPVEIKWADASSWSAKKLLERLEVQLVGQYLRAENVHFGIFLVARIDLARAWNHPTDNRRIDYEELIQLLNERARELEQLPGVSGIRVVGIDFTVPATPSASFTKGAPHANHR